MLDTCFLSSFKEAIAVVSVKIKNIEKFPKDYGLRIYNNDLNIREKWLKMYKYF